MRHEFDRVMSGRVLPRRKRRHPPALGIVENQFDIRGCMEGKGNFRDTMRSDRVRMILHQFKLTDGARRFDGCCTADEGQGNEAAAEELRYIVFRNLEPMFQELRVYLPVIEGINKITAGIDNIEIRIRAENTAVHRFAE